ncbi:MAG: hypothetical protein RJB38_532 [Pseudomonadota bacterium]|jgi:cell division protein FtsI/penicillin-binding protein 2
MDNEESMLAPSNQINALNSSKRGWRLLVLPVGLLALILSARIAGSVQSSSVHQGPLRSSLTRQELAQALSQAPVGPGLPRTLEVSFSGKKRSARIEYTFDVRLQEAVEKMLLSSDPDYGALAAVDPQSGRVLALASHESRRVTSKAHKPRSLDEHLALRASFPSASIFKVVTAAAVIAEKRFTADTRVAFSGSNHTLYKKQVLTDHPNRWTRSMSLRDAFAKSVNTVFGKIGVFNLGAEPLREYAGRFGFNRSIASDLPVQPGKAPIPENADAWTLAEAASGFTRENTMSPLQGSLIAAALVNDGKMIAPQAVQSVWLEDGQAVYQMNPSESYDVVSPQVAAQMRELMRETVVSGTSRKTFRGFHRGKTASIDAGGKTGSLTGNDPEGKYDWFVGFGALQGKKIALAALTIHKKQWRIKSSALARRAIETYLLPVRQR